MHGFKGLLCFQLLAAFVAGSPLAEFQTRTTKPAPDRVKRFSAGASAYPYGTELVNEFGWLGWTPQDTGDDRNDGVKIHNGYADMINMVYFAWREADRKSDTFKRWFDEADADNVKKVFEQILDPNGVGNAKPLMKDWTLERPDTYKRCTATKNAFSAYERGVFHMCPKGIAQPNAGDLKCDQLDGFASQKMKSVAFTMMHEAMHWNKIGDAALGKHIKDVKLPNGLSASGSYDCFQLAGPDKLINAQNYAYLGAEAYFMVKQCTFTDPPPGTAGTDDTDDEVNGTDPTPTPEPAPEPTTRPTPEPQPAPPPYNPGTCCFHLTETELPCADDSDNLRGIIKMLDDKKEVIGETDVGDDGIGERIDDGNSYHFKSKLLNELVITGEHQHDYVQFTIGGLSWQSSSPNGGAQCTVGGWDPRSGPYCDFFGVQKATREMDCCFPCDGTT